jgi:hypothetical protein
MKRNILIPILITFYNVFTGQKSRGRYANSCRQTQRQKYILKSITLQKEEKKVLKSKLQRKVPEMCLNEHTWAIPR